MSRPTPVLLTLLPAAVAFLTNLVVDVTTDLPMLVRWGVALLAALAVGVLVTLRSQSARARSAPSRPTQRR